MTPVKNRYAWLMLASQSNELQSLLLEQCRRDILFWFEAFCWTFDPRTRPSHQPFRLYPYQRDFVLELRKAIDGGHDLLVEKSRDMGVSWLILLTFQYYWLFCEGSHFLVGSRKADYVDQKGDLSTLFEKLRYNLQWLPPWMHPAGFAPRRHDTLMRLINPANGNTITGESSNPNFGRGGRYRAIFLDEFPFWPCDAEAYASSGQSSPSRIVVGTPYGKANKFAQLRFNSPIRVRSLHWKLHPLKDANWYAGQARRMSADEIARELDINYNLSVSNRVFSGFGEEHKGDLQPVEGRRIVRSWDFGYHCPACVFIQLDAGDRVQVLAEIVGRQELLIDFARRVKTFSQSRFEGFEFEDVCDPAGTQRSDKHDQTSIEILNSLGIYPFYQRSPILRGIELIRMKLAERNGDLPGLRVNRDCTRLIDAFEGGYRYASTDHELPIEEHPYEDVMDCLRYAILHKCGISSKAPKKPRRYKPANRHTGY